MNKKVLTAVVLGIVSSGYFSRISEAVMLDTVYVEADRIHDEYAGGFVDRGTDMGILGKQDYMSVPVQGLSVTANVIENIKLPNNTLSEAVTLCRLLFVQGAVMLTMIYLSEVLISVLMITC